jgi:hypothetical protein
MRKRSLDRFLVDGYPDETRFHPILGALVDIARSAARSPEAPIRAWGEMVDILYQRGDQPAAWALERAWNEAISVRRIELLCSYRVDKVEAMRKGILGDICRGHTRLIAEEDEGFFERAVLEALETEVGHGTAHQLWTAHGARPPLDILMPPAEAVLVSLHAQDPGLASRVTDRIAAAMAMRR